MEQGFTSLSIRRPMLTLVINLLIILAGAASLFGLDVRELPDVDRPVVSVRANYAGASPKTMDTEVTSVLEGAVARVSGVKEIASSSEENNMRMRVEFEPGYDLDTAANDVREAISRVQRDLPEDIDQVIIAKADDDADPILQMSAFSDTLSVEELGARLEKDVAPELLSIEGVADVRMDGDQPRALRVLLDPAKLAAHRLSISDVVAAMRSTRLDVPAGSYLSEDQELLVRAYASVLDPERVKEIYLRDQIQVGDVAQVFFAPQEAESYTLLNGRRVIGLGVVRRAGSNTIAIAQEVKARLQDINRRSRDYQIQVTSDDSVFIQGALREVVSSLLLSVLFVLVIIGLFLGQLRTVLVPAVTMPVSLIGTLAAIWLFGFSINLLTLLALVLATGLIVDDAIVVLENIQRRRGQGLGALAAAVLGTQQVFFAVIATTVTLVAVFLPIVFLPGQTGQLFREFGLVLVISVVISSVVAVTLCPLLAARVAPPPGRARGLLRRGLEAVGDLSAKLYLKSLRAVLAWPHASLLLAVVAALAGVLGFARLNQELLPIEDRGELVMVLTGPDGASLEYSGEQSVALEEVLAPYAQQGQIRDIYTIVGRWDKNRVFTSAQLQPWGQRQTSQMELAAQISPQVAQITGGQVRIRQRSSLSLGGGGGGGGLDLSLLGNEYEDILVAADKLAEVLPQRVPAVTGVTVQFDTSQPELSFGIDRDRAQDLDVPLENISQTLRVMVDEFEVLDLSIEDQAVPVALGPAQGAIGRPDDLLNLFVNNRAGEPVPLRSLLTVQERGVAAELDRRAQRRCIDVDINLEPGAPLGEVLEQVRAVGDEVLPPNIRMLARGEAASLDETSYEVSLTFLLALLVVFLVLAAQFESLGSAVIVIFTVPFGMAAAVFALLWTDQTLNLYSQIGLVMLIGLMTKNAILLVEFMDQLREEGMSVEDAVMEGVRVRLRPVAMTVLSTVLGSLPLIVGEGPGMEARQAIGWVIFGGLGMSTLFTLYLTPLGYWLLAPWTRSRAHMSQRLDKELEDARALP